MKGFHSQLVAVLAADVQSASQTADDVKHRLDTVIKMDRWVPTNGYDPLSEVTGFFAYSVNPNLMIAQGIPTGLSDYAAIIGCNLPMYQIMLYIDVFGKMAIWSTHSDKWILYNN